MKGDTMKSDTMNDQQDTPSTSPMQGPATHSSRARRRDVKAQEVLVVDARVAPNWSEGPSIHQQLLSNDPEMPWRVGPAQRSLRDGLVAESLWVGNRPHTFVWRIEKNQVMEWDQHGTKQRSDRVLSPAGRVVAHLHTNSLKALEPLALRAPGEAPGGWAVGAGAASEWILMWAAWKIMNSATDSTPSSGGLGMPRLLHQAFPGRMCKLLDLMIPAPPEDPKELARTVEEFWRNTSLMTRLIRLEIEKMHTMHEMMGAINGEIFAGTTPAQQKKTSN